MIEQLRLRGRGGTVNWGYRPIAELGAWVILRAMRPTGRSDPTRKMTPRGWQLHAGVVRADAFALRQKDLYFTAPRLVTEGGGFWYFPLLEAPTVDRGILRAPVRAPER